MIVSCTFHTKKYHWPSPLDILYRNQEINGETLYVVSLHSLIYSLTNANAPFYHTANSLLRFRIYCHETYTGVQLTNIYITHPPSMDSGVDKYFIYFPHCAMLVTHGRHPTRTQIGRVTQQELGITMSCAWSGSPHFLYIYIASLTHTNLHHYQPISSPNLFNQSIYILYIKKSIYTFRGTLDFDFRFVGGWLFL